MQPFLILWIKRLSLRLRPCKIDVAYCLSTVRERIKRLVGRSGVRGYPSDSGGGTSRGSVDLDSGS